MLMKLLRDKFNVNYTTVTSNKLEEVMINWKDTKKSNERLDNILQPKK